MRNFGSPAGSLGAPSSSAEEPSLIGLAVGGTAAVLLGLTTLGLMVGAGAIGGVFAGTAAINAYKTVTGNKLSQKADDKAMMTSTTLFALGVPAFIIYKTATMTDAERAAHRAQYGQATPR